MNISCDLYVCLNKIARMVSDHHHIHWIVGIDLLAFSVVQTKPNQNHPYSIKLSYQMWRQSLYKWTMRARAIDVNHGNKRPLNTSYALWYVKIVCNRHLQDDSLILIESKSIHINSHWNKTFFFLSWYVCYVPARV